MAVHGTEPTFSEFMNLYVARVGQEYSMLYSRFNRRVPKGIDCDALADGDMLANKFGDGWFITVYDSGDSTKRRTILGGDSNVKIDGYNHPIRICYSNNVKSDKYRYIKLN